jgi:hypothetical protein
MPRKPAACHTGTALREPGRRRMALDVGRLTPAGQLCRSHRAPEAFLDGGDRVAVEFDEAFGDQFQPSPSSHVGQQARRYRRRRLALFIHEK